MSGKWEIPVFDIEAVQEIMQRPLRYRQLALWDYLLPPDDSLEVYRQNLKAAGKGRAAKLRAAAVARHQDRYGHEADYDRHGQCRVCSTRRYLKSYRLRNGIPLDVEVASPAETKQPLCPHGHRRTADAYNCCVKCRRDRQRRYVSSEDRKEAKREYDRQRYLARKRMSA